jgi:hypothetical protein
MLRSITAVVAGTLTGLIARRREMAHAVLLGGGLRGRPRRRRA